LDVWSFILWPVTMWIPLSDDIITTLEKQGSGSQDSPVRPIRVLFCFFIGSISFSRILNWFRSYDFGSLSSFHG